MKMSSAIGAAATMLALLAASPAVLAQETTYGSEGRYLVKFRDFAGAARAVNAAGGRVEVELAPQRAIAAHLTVQALRGLQNNPNVEYVEVDAVRYPLAQSTPWGIPYVQADNAAFAVSNASNGAMVCIIDSGYQIAHEDLQDSNVTGTNDTGTGNWNEDTCGHGSHVAGTIAALNNNVGVVGVNKNGLLKLHIEKVFTGASCGWAYSSSLVTALNRCQAAAGTNKLVVSMSLGGTTSSTTENNAFQTAYNNGVLPIAAAGNDGNTRTSYPAGYASVMSVAAVDSTGTVAAFSQKNADVEIAAPGVGVVSTTPFKSSTLTVNGNSFIGTTIEGAARTSATGALVAGGLCDTTGAGAWTGKVVLCQRGTIDFATKVNNVKNGGGLGAAIYNNVSGGFSGTLGTGVTSTIPAISLSQEDGQAALSSVGSSATLDNTAGVGNGYEAYDGTSMATPHVSGVAALVWSLNSGKTNAQIRDALVKTAIDKGTAGRDTSYGYGIVQAKAAHDYLQNAAPPPAAITLSVTKVKASGSNYADLRWANSTAAGIDVFRNGTKIVTNTANDGLYRDGPVARGTYTYKVCDNGSTTICSPSVTVKF